MPLRQQLAGEWSTLQYFATGTSPSDRVFIGNDGTFFLAEDFVSACQFDYQPKTVTDRVAAWKRHRRGPRGFGVADGRS